MRALKEFRYTDFQTGESVTVRAGEEVDVGRLEANRCDLEKFQRVKLVAQVEQVETAAPREVLVVKKRRGRPPKPKV